MDHFYKTKITFLGGNTDKSLFVFSIFFKVLVLPRQTSLTHIWISVDILRTSCWVSPPVSHVKYLCLNCLKNLVSSPVTLLPFCLWIKEGSLCASSYHLLFLSEIPRFPAAQWCLLHFILTTPCQRDNNQFRNFTSFSNTQVFLAHQMMRFSYHVS